MIFIQLYSYNVKYIIFTRFRGPDKIDSRAACGLANLIIYSIYRYIYIYILLDIIRWRWTFALWMILASVPSLYIFTFQPLLEFKLLAFKTKLWFFQNTISEHTYSILLRTLQMDIKHFKMVKTLGKSKNAMLLSLRCTKETNTVAQ